MKAIKSNDTIYAIINKYPDVVEIMVELGFKDIVKPGMLQTVGKFMTLEKGAKAKNIEWSLIVDTFKEHEYELVQEDKK